MLATQSRTRAAVDATGRMGYQGALFLDRVIHPKKKPVGKQLEIDDVEKNTNISSDSIVAEKFTGRLYFACGFLGRKWKWSEKYYKNFF